MDYFAAIPFQLDKMVDLLMNFNFGCARDFFTANRHTFQRKSKVHKP